MKGKKNINLILLILISSTCFAQNVKFDFISGTSFSPCGRGSIAFADIDGDNDQDVLMTGYSGAYPIARMYMNDGNGNFTLKTGTPFSGSSNSSIAFADVDGDNDQDVLITGKANQWVNNAKLYINDGNGNFTLKTGTPFTGVYLSSIAFADVDGDNDQDVLITGGTSSTNNSRADLYINDGNGNFTLATGTPFSGVSYSSIAFADIDGDNDQDVLICGKTISNQITSKLYINDGNGNFSLQLNTPFVGISYGSIAFADVDGDNDQDVLITGDKSTITGSVIGFSELYINDGFGNFTLDSGTPFHADGPIYYSSIAFADIDGDNDQDVLITGGNKKANLYINDSNGNFSLKTSTPFAGVNWSSIAFADIDGDSDQDVLITGYNYINAQITRLYRNSPCINDTTISLTRCSSYTSPSGNYTWTSSNTYIDTILNTNNCDSIITINLTINNPSIGIDTITACNSLNWIDGTTYTSNNNTATFNILGGNSNGCDSLVTLNLTISNLNANYTLLDNGNGNYSFTNTSIGNFNKSHWAFGDGTVDSTANTNHTFATNGNFMVVLTINDSTVHGDSCISYYLDTIDVTGVNNSLPCHSGFVIYPDSTTGDINVVNSSTGTNLTYLWSFGDGNTSSLQNPSHTYATAGPFYLCLTIDDGNGCSDMYCDSIGKNGVIFNKAGGFTINVISPNTTSIDNNIDLNSEVIIYPNPTSHQLTIDTELEISKITIIDISGKIIKTITTDLNSIDVSDLSDGIYFIKLITDERTISKKFVKQ